jgi:TolA-binding protein
MQSEVAQMSLSDKLWAWFESNKKQAFYGIVALLFLGVVIGFVIWHKGEKEIAAGEALSSVSLRQTPGTGVRGAEPAEAYLKVAAEYPHSSAAARAVLLAAGSQFDQAKYDQAKAEFERFMREYQGSSFMGEALLGIAACYDAQSKTNEAITAYRNLVEHHPGESSVPQAKFALGRLYESQNKPEQARTMFEDVVRGDPYGSIGSEAGIRLEELKQKYPSLVPPPATLPAPTFTAPPPGTLPLTNIGPLKMEKK